LKEMGYEVIKRGQIGRTEVIKINRPKKNKLVFEAVGDNRGDDDAEAF
jgi:gamma-glutamyltranspeptidase / glutathione hydrolase